MQAGALAALEYAALHRHELLENFWTKGERSLTKGRTEAPYAWAFPPEQRDPARLAYLVNQLRQHRIEVHRLTSEARLGAKTWPAGTYVVRMDQPYRDFAVNLLEEQKFPADEPNPPYDDVAWTWPLLYGVAAERVNDKKVFDAAMEPVAADVLSEGRIEGEGEVFLLRDSGQTALLEARVLLGTHQVDAAAAAFTAGDVSYPPGSWIVQAPREAVEEVARRTGLSFTAAAALPEVKRHLVDLPRLAILHSWTDTQAAGWVRYTFDRGKIPYALISDDDLERGGLAERFDVILFPETRGSVTDLVHGIDPKYGPLAYTATPEFPSHGVPDASEDITGGMGFTGLLNLQRFLQEGGVLIALANAGTLPVQAGLVRNAFTAPAANLNSPGSELRAKILRPEHPIVYGYEPLPSIFRGNGPLFDVPRWERSRVVLQFGTKDEEEDEKEGKGAEGKDEIEEEDLESGDAPAAPEPMPQKKAKDEGPLVLSGFVQGEDAIDGKPAILDLPAGRGRVILYTFNPLHRYLNLSDFRFVYNALLHWNDLPQ
jgi:hypothetical protein